MFRWFSRCRQRDLAQALRETRRIHPLSKVNIPTRSIKRLIKRRRSSNHCEIADILLDSSNQSLHELSETIRTRVEGHERKELIMVF